MLLIKNANINPISGVPIACGSILVTDGGKIAAVAQTLEAPAGCQVIDAGGRLVKPGCV